jgi:sulfide:quinone oxidoreductase
MTAGGDSRVRVLIAGGGIAALESLLALRALAGDRVAITVLAPEAELVYRPVTVAEAFGRAEARSFQVAEILADQNARHLADSLERLDPDARMVITGSGAAIPYDALVIATGARATEPLPGALTFGGRKDVPALRALLTDLVDGRARSVAFAVTRGQAWALPLYELALMTAAHLREHGAQAAVQIVTPEEMPLAIFGPEAELAIRPMLSALRIAVRCSAMPALVKPRELVLTGGSSVVADRVVTLPQICGPRLSGLPADEHGFIPVDAHGRVSGLIDVYAAGDVTTFPLKQGGLATQQADAVAEMIAAGAGAPLHAKPFRPVLRGLLITSGAPLYLRSEPQRIPRLTSVAIDVRRPPQAGHTASMASDQALWWPPAKIAGQYLAPYLATARPSPLAGEPLVDRAAISGPWLAEAEYNDAVELVLLLADGDAGWGDYRSALSALESAEALEGALPPEYEAKRALWLRELEREG